MRFTRERPAIAAFFARFRALPACSWLACALFLSSACAREDLSLLHPRALEIDEDADLAYVLGDGFVTGAHCSLSLSGTAYPTGKRQQPLAIDVPCRVLTEERCVLDLSTASLAEQERGWFEGRLVLRLSAGEAQETSGNREARAVSGKLEHVRLRLGRRGPGDVDQTLAFARAATRFQHQLGVLGVESSAQGLRITALGEDAAFARAGGQPGDLVRRLNGAPVEDSSDFLPPAQVSSLRVEVVRRGQGNIELTLPWNERPSLPLGPTLLAGLLACVLAALLPQGRRFAPERPRLLPQLAFAGAACVMLGFGFVLGELDVTVPWLLVLLAHGARAWLAHVRGRRSMLDLLGEASDAAQATLCIATLAILTGSLRTPLWLSEGAPTLAQKLALFASPAGWCAGLGLVLALGKRDRARGLTHSLLCATAALACAALGLGAGQLPWELPEWNARLLTLLAVLGFLMRSYALYWLLTSVRLPRHARRFGLGFALTALLLALLAPRLLPQSIPEELYAAVSLGALLGFLGRERLGHSARKHETVRDPALRPFL